VILTSDGATVSSTTSTVEPVIELKVALMTVTPPRIVDVAIPEELMVAAAVLELDQAAEEVMLA
jgi:hypothetical protein